MKKERKEKKRKEKKRKEEKRQDKTKSLQVSASTGSPWAHSQWTPPRSLEDSPHDIRTSGEWNTTSVPIQSCRT